MKIFNVTFTASCASVAVKLEVLNAIFYLFYFFRKSQNFLVWIKSQHQVWNR